MPSRPESLQEISSGLLRDLKCALLQMRRNPTFTAVVILMLALGLGASTAVFSELYATVLKPRHIALTPTSWLLFITTFRSSIWFGCRPRSFDYLDLREQRDLFSDIGLHYFLDLNHTGSPAAGKGERRGHDIQHVPYARREATDRDACSPRKRSASTDRIP